MTDVEAEVSDTGPWGNARVSGHPCASEAAFGAFYAETSGRLWSFLYYLCGDRMLADDLVQETYLRFLRSAATVAPGPALVGYLYRIAANLCTDHQRRRKLERRWLPASHSDCEFREQEGDSQRASARRMESAVQLSSLIGKLKTREQLLVWLAYGEGMDHRQIASRLSLKEKSVKVLLFRIRRRLVELSSGRKRVEP